jgi:hypothetical protein
MDSWCHRVLVPGAQTQTAGPDCGGYFRPIQPLRTKKIAKVGVMPKQIAQNMSYAQAKPFMKRTRMERVGPRRILAGALEFAQEVLQPMFVPFVTAI